MGSKYRPSIKDLKATQRFHQNAKRVSASGAVKKSLYLPSTQVKTKDPAKIIEASGPGPAK